MLGRRIDFRSAIDGLLLAVPIILLGFVIPRPLVRIALDWTYAHPEAGVDMVSAVYAYILLTLPVMWIAARLPYPPFLVTTPRLLFILAVTLLAIALTAIDMNYGD